MNSKYLQEKIYIAQLNLYTLPNFNPLPYKITQSYQRFIALHCQ